MAIIESNQRIDLRPIGSSGTVLRSKPGTSYGVSWGSLSSLDIATNVDIISFSIAPSAVLVGSTVSSGIFSFAFNVAPSGDSISCPDTSMFQSSPLIGNSPVALNFVSPITKSTVGATSLFTMTANGSYGDTDSTGFTMKWLQYQYFGVAYDLGSYTSGFILSLSNRRLNSLHATAFSASVTGSAKLWYAHRNALGTPHFFNYYGGLEGGFTSISTGILLQNSAGYSEYYQLWVSDYAGIGSVVIQISDEVNF